MIELQLEVYGYKSFAFISGQKTYNKYDGNYYYEGFHDFKVLFELIIFSIFFL